MANAKVSGAEVRSRLLKLGPTNLKGVQRILPPPKGFNPFTANKRTLLRHGYPLRPDPLRLAALARQWDVVMARGLEHVSPMLRVRPDRKDVGRSKKDFADNTSTNWSGGVAATAGQFQSVLANWTVPSIAPPTTSGNGDWWSVAWVGMDGWTSNDVLQAGTGQHAKRVGTTVTTEYFAWYEWYPDNWVEITSFAVAPGDAIQISVNYDGISGGKPRGSASFVNMTTGKATGVSFAAPSGTTFTGDTAEWIMERPTINGTVASLPDFGEITFRSCAACTAQGTGVYGSAGTSTDMINGAKSQLVDASLNQDWDCFFLKSK